MSCFFDGFDGLLVDMDGVLYDSMKGHTLAWHSMMSDLGVETSRDEFYLYEGMTGKATINLLFRRAFNRDASPDEAERLYHRKTEIFRSYPRPDMIPGAARMLDAFGRAGLRRVLVTGSAQGSLLETLDNDYPGVFPKDRRVTALDVAHGKPDPEPYLKGAALAGADPRRCIVVENAPLGVRAGKGAGCFTVAVTTGPIPREEFEKEGADMIFGSMEEFADWVEETSLRRCGEVIASDDPAPALERVAELADADRWLVVTDSTVRSLWQPLLGRFVRSLDAEVVVLPPGESGKSLESVTRIWTALSDGGYTRRSVVVNFGGGSVSDTGGFAAATFKRGIRFVNVATTLLGAADASIGGKTGIDFNGKKNEVGVFRMPLCVIVGGKTFASLPREEVLSGMGEVIKTALLDSEEFYSATVEAMQGNDISPGAGKPAELAARAGSFKECVVSGDPEERGYRKILNLGHTGGHAFESLGLRRGLRLTHGECVAHGLYVALLLSEETAGLAAGTAEGYRREILSRFYRKLPFGEEDAGELIRIMGSDKKNRRAGEPEFVLLRGIGRPVWGQRPKEEAIRGALLKALGKQDCINHQAEARRGDSGVAYEPKND